MQYEKNYWINDKTRIFMSRGYLSEGQTVEQRIREIAKNAERILKIKGFADKFEDYMSRGWYSLASPVWSNFGSKKGLPISCNGSYIDDSVESILAKTAEIGMLSKYGAGTSAFYGGLRNRGSDISTGGKTSGPVHFMELANTTVNVISQSNVRRGSCAVYLPVDHQDIEEFLEIREEGNPIQNLSIGVCISDRWMTEMIDGDKTKRSVWGRILKKRFATGYPYLFFTDTVNNNAPKVYKDKGLKIHASNLCTEICNSSSVDETFVCDLSSLNLLHYPEWKDTDAIQILTFFLDAVMSEYIDKTEGIRFIEAARNFAIRQRSLGVGVLGWHSFLQSQMIPFESMEAKRINMDIFELIQKETLKATKEMASMYGEPPLLKGYGVRNVTLVAVAPTTSSSFILGQVSSGIEPMNSNYYTKDLAKGRFTYKNPFLKDLLKKHDKDSKEVWESILKSGGSVQHLKFLSDEEKAVFKTFGEISQYEIILQAAQRQKYIDQAQSLNLMIHPKTPPKEVSNLLIEGWKMGVKTFYYQRSTSPTQELNRNLTTCTSCES